MTHDTATSISRGGVSRISRLDGVHATGLLEVATDGSRGYDLCAYPISSCAVLCLVKGCSSDWWKVVSEVWWVGGGFDVWCARGGVRSHLMMELIMDHGITASRRVFCLCRCCVDLLFRRYVSFSDQQCSL